MLQDTKAANNSCYYQGDLSVDQANKLDMLLSQDEEQQTMAQFGGGAAITGSYDTRADRSLIEDSCDQKMRKEFYADGGPGQLMSTSRQSSLLAELTELNKNKNNYYQDLEHNVDDTLTANQLIVYS